ncbi:hypothetical protein IFM89_004491 [Coptis chinensis]|uniref:Protein N-terminal asparagine amidohydrolase n=1 Tax=Coptis chinensis TaxID=261450 RepID=A0A835GVB7_9MAGN|nr:hypothetical protein IFM89_004491 [Coptis chinensis]
MIFVDGLPFSGPTSSQAQGSDKDLVIALLQHPTLVSSSNAIKSLPERKVLFSQEYDGVERSTHRKLVYVFQREYATVDPELVELVGTDEATTCVGVVIRNRKTGMTSVSHIDSPNVVDQGLNQMLSLLVDENSNDELEVHLVGGFEDTSPENNAISSEEHSGHSFPLCSMLLHALKNRRERFHIQTLFVLGHNTGSDSDRYSYPIMHGFVVETCTGTISPANFDRTSRCPDEIVRRIRVTVSSGDPTWNRKLLETYDTKNDRFQIAACSWTSRWKYIAFSLQQLSDSEILLRCSTSPFVEGPDFVDNERRILHLCGVSVGPLPGLRRDSVVFYWSPIFQGFILSKSHQFRTHQLLNAIISPVPFTIVYL